MLTSTFLNLWGEDLKGPSQNVWEGFLLLFFWVHSEALFGEVRQQEEHLPQMEGKQKEVLRPSCLCHQETGSSLSCSEDPAIQWL